MTLPREGKSLRESGLRSIWANGGCALNAWVLSPSPVQAELFAGLGWGSVTVDLQHGALDYQDAVRLFQAISLSSATPLARVPTNEPGMIGKVLDAGAYGIVCPLVNTPDEADRFVRACRYPPEGVRSFGPHRALSYGGDGYVSGANETIVAIAQIETAEAVENLEQILATPGLDAIYVGSADLSLSMGGPPVIDHADPAAAAIHRELIEAAHRADVRVGLHALALEDAALCVEAGADLVTLNTDHGLLLGAATQLIDNATREIDVARGAAR